MQSQSICKDNYRPDTLVSEIDEKKERNIAKMEALRQRKEIVESKAARDRENSSKIGRKAKEMTGTDNPKRM